MKKTGTVRSELSVIDNASKEERHRGMRTKRVKTNVENDDANFAVVKVSNNLKLAMGFQSVGVDVGIEMPWEVRVGPKGFEDVKEGFDRAYAFLDDELASRAKEIEPLLQSLARKYSRR